MKYSLANMKKEMHTTQFRLMQLSQQLTITSSTYLFATLITVDGISCDSRPSTCGDNKNVLKLSLKIQLSHGVNY